MYLYYAKFSYQNKNARAIYKIGVSSDPIKRINIIKNELKAKSSDFLYFEEFDTDEEAFQAETLIKNLFKDYRIGSGFPYHTEIFNTDILMKDSA